MSFRVDEIIDVLKLSLGENFIELEDPSESMLPYLSFVSKYIYPDFYPRDKAELVYVVIRGVASATPRERHAYLEKLLKSSRDVRKSYMYMYTPENDRVKEVMTFLREQLGPSFERLIELKSVDLKKVLKRIDKKLVKDSKVSKKRLVQDLYLSLVSMYETKRMKILELLYEVVKVSSRIKTPYTFMSRKDKREELFSKFSEESYLVKGKDK